MSQEGLRDTIHGHASLSHATAQLTFPSQAAPMPAAPNNVPVSIVPAPPYPTGRSLFPKKRELRDTICQNCERMKEQTNMWRTNTYPPRVPAVDNVLCNACGLWLAEHGHHRPKEWWYKTKARNRYPSADRQAEGARTANERRVRDRRSALRNPNYLSLVGQSTARYENTEGVDRQQAASALISMGAPPPAHTPIPRPSWIDHPPPTPLQAFPIAPFPGLYEPRAPFRHPLAIADLLNPKPVSPTIAAGSISDVEAREEIGIRFHPYEPVACRRRT
ncbi:uncharacterized protein I303_100562 [Kwoniella dejecticola CBS 10117]|uniref:GATA-type domain-containing protein n=1 Tax=Kwoniella dejecticola CBS 10117 TaxID=1296121 RepID=A0A1A6AFB1_9TREE|nr:uncharacterized protein I303_00563 [Kwoniella dejecticola CBS 10117]OBR88746.1 hypothetical protein I303_00563 [Kwoniella dejecticola CBS 10117]